MSGRDVISHVAAEFVLNEKQHVAYRMICDFFIARYVNKQLDASDVGGQLTMLMTGPGGTGKTHVVKAVQTVMKSYGYAHLIRFLAPTGSAAALIDGMTIHKGLGIKIRSANKGKGNRDPGNGAEDLSVLVSIQNRTQIREEWKNVEFLLIDEVSLLSLQLIADIDHTL
ncbi:hypothetical protein P692DRAFT_20734276, partial [Suillus brevipes Sb2]